MESLHSGDGEFLNLNAIIYVSVREGNSRGPGFEVAIPAEIGCLRRGVEVG